MNTLFPTYLIFTGGFNIYCNDCEIDYPGAISCCNICGSELNDSSPICPNCHNEIPPESVICDNCSDKVLIAIKLSKGSTEDKCPFCQSRKLNNEIIGTAPNGPNRLLQNCKDCGGKFISDKVILC